MATLSITERILAFEDLEQTSDPQKRYFDWTMRMNAIPLNGKPWQKSYDLAPGETATVFDGTRTLGTNGSTTFDLTYVTSLKRYRLAWAGAGTSPAFRTARTVASSGGNLILALGGNQTLQVTSSLGAIFGAVVAGDEVLVPGALTGDTPLFSSLNEGTWIVLAADSSTLTLVREEGTVFAGESQTVVPISADAQFQVFSAAGVQVGDALSLSAGFTAATLKTYTVVSVTASRVEFESGVPLAPQSAIVTGASGIAVYSSSKRYVRAESAELVAVRCNGDTTDNTRVSPFIAGQTGWFEKVGPTFSMALHNLSGRYVTVSVTAAE